MKLCENKVHTSLYPFLLLKIAIAYLGNLGKHLGICEPQDTMTTIEKNKTLGELFN